MEKGIGPDGRLTHGTALINDRPGGLAFFCRMIAGFGVSIKDLLPDRAFCGPVVSAGHLVCPVERRDGWHSAALHRALRLKGHPLTAW